MRALCWMGKGDVSVETVPDPRILNPRDAILRVTSTAICGSDLHLFGGFIPTMKKGDILGHEFMGEVVEVGPEQRGVSVGDRVLIPFPIACGNCYFCRSGLTSCCDNSNPKARIAETLMQYSPAGIYGYSHMTGGYAGGQAQYVRVPYADANAFRVPEGVPDEQVLFLTDIFPTGWMAADNCEIEKGDTVAVFGCGPVGQFAIRSCFLMGAERVIAIDSVAERLAMAEAAGAEVMDESEGEVLERLRHATGGVGPDACIDAVGLEAHGHGATDWYDRAKQAVRMEADRPIVLRTAIEACRKAGVVSFAGVYGGMIDKVPMGAAFNKGLTFRMGQTHVHRYVPHLMGLIEQGAIDPSFVITHRMPLEQAPTGYEMFREKRDGCIKVVLRPQDGAADVNDEEDAEDADLAENEETA
jgi:threonine dehydrogenase-like Zn-dependent dehydrogenase